MNVTVLLQVLGFLSAHASDIKQLILALENVVVEGVSLAGPAKADVVKGYIAVANNISAEIDSVWPVALPIFNEVVSAVKGKSA